jgi:hypothetical protein
VTLTVMILRAGCDYRATGVARLTGISLAPRLAVSAVLTYRLATYWLPVLPGWISWRYPRSRSRDDDPERTKLSSFTRRRPTWPPPYKPRPRKQRNESR